MYDRYDQNPLYEILKELIKVLKHKDAVSHAEQAGCSMKGCPMAHWATSAVHIQARAVCAGSHHGAVNDYWSLLGVLSCNPNMYL